MNKPVLILLFIGLFGNLYSQRDTIVYYGKNGKVVRKKSEAVAYEKIKKKHIDRFELQKEAYYEGTWHRDDKQIIQIVNDTTLWLFNENRLKGDTIVRIVNKMQSGYLIKEYANRKLLSTGVSSLMFPIIRESKWTFYYPGSGLVQSEVYYQGNLIMSNRNWKETGEEDISDVFSYADTIPQFEGGEKGWIKFLNEKLKYPAEAQEKNIQGTVVLQFVIMEDGKIEGIKILRKQNPLLDYESYRVVKLSSGKWKPGILNGKPVRVYFTLPVSFQM
jgi:TonB family protein